MHPLQLLDWKQRFPDAVAKKPKQPRQLRSTKQGGTSASGQEDPGAADAASSAAAVAFANALSVGAVDRAASSPTALAARQTSATAVRWRVARRRTSIPGSKGFPWSMGERESAFMAYAEQLVLLHARSVIGGDGKRTYVTR